MASRDISDIKNLTQNEIIKIEIFGLIQDGITDKTTIFDTIQKASDFPRPTIRRASKNLRAELEKVLEILSSDVENHKDGWQKKKLQLD